MKIIILTIAIVILSNIHILCQQTDLQIGTQIPLCYSIGLEHHIGKKISINFQAGILTSPYDKIILNMLNVFGTDETLTKTIGNAFSIGYMFQPTLKFNFGKNYLGASYSIYSLFANHLSADDIESYYSVTLPRRLANPNNNYALTSNLQNIGILYGRYFTFRNPHYQIRAEVSFAKTFISSSTLSSEHGDLSRINPTIDKELNQYYIDYGYLPSINIFWVYKFGRF